MRTRRPSPLLAGLGIMLLLFTACTSQTPSVSNDGSSAPAAPAAAPSSGPKTITLGIQREPAGFEPELMGATGGAAGGQLQVRPIAQDYLVAPRPDGNTEARLAVEKPSLERGTWKVNSDGTMELTWTLRPNIKWHDGTPFTSADLAFGYEVRQDPQLARISSGGGRPELMESVSTPDPLTFVVRWKQIYVLANEGDGVEPLPRHLLEALYRQDKEAMTQSRYLSSEFVGLGAYKLVHWEQGSHMEFARNDDYYLGRPHFDRLFLRFVPDVNTLVANILSGSVDVVLPPTVDLDTAVEMQQRWQGTGNQVRVDVGSEMKQLELQHRPEYAKPSIGWTNRSVRQALYQSIDKQTFVDVMTHGLAPIADSWYAPNDPVRKDVEAFIPSFPYDLNRAQQLMTQAGWARGSDGILVYPPTGERFEVEITYQQGTGPEKEASIIADGWKSIGVQTSYNGMTPALINDREKLATRSGPYITMPPGINFYDRRLHSSTIGRPETRWTGTNRGGYNNPKVDDILDRLAITIEPRARIELHKELLQEQMVDIAVMPIHWATLPILMLKGITGPQTTYNNATSHIWTWDRQ